MNMDRKISMSDLEAIIDVINTSNFLASIYSSHAKWR